eukprot:4920868-Prymnesium_polylepis.1
MAVLPLTPRLPSHFCLGRRPTRLATTPSRSLARRPPRAFAVTTPQPRLLPRDSAEQWHHSPSLP